MAFTVLQQTECVETNIWTLRDPYNKTDLATSRAQQPEQRHQKLQPTSIAWSGHSLRRSIFPGNATQHCSPIASPGSVFNYSAIKSPMITFSLTSLCYWKYFTPIHPSKLSLGCCYTWKSTQQTLLCLSEKPKTAELHVVKRDSLSSAPARQAALCSAFLGITGDGDSKPLCHSSGKKPKHKQNQTEKPDLQNKEVIPVTAHLALGHWFITSKTTLNPSTLSLFCLCNRFPARKQQPCLPR